MNHRSSSIRSGRFALAALLALALAWPGAAPAAVGDRSPDNVWREVGDDAVAPSLLVEEFEGPGAYRLLELNDLALFSILREAPPEFDPGARASAPILSLPLPDGGFGRFRVMESPILSAKLAAENPDIRTYIIQGVDDPTYRGRISRTPLGFYGIVITPTDFLVVSRSTNAASNLYVNFWKSDLPTLDGMTCSVEEPEGPRLQERLELQAPPSGANLRTYNLAIVTTDEYTAFFGGPAGVPGAITNVMTAVNTLYEAEMAIRFTVTCTNIWNGGDPFTDPQTVDGALLDEADSTLDANCGNYQIGHLFHRRAGAGTQFSGRAGGSIVCQAAAGRAASTITNPNSTLFTVDLVPHEMGHQFSAAHTYNSTAGGCVERTASAAYEIGAGTTIMSYACAGCTGEDANGGGCADAYFHTHSFDQITNYREAGGNCGAQTATGNNAPGVNAGGDFTIPRNTPFTLTATGSDPDGDAVTWCWEQYDLGAASPPLGGGGPLFRSFLPVASPSRTFPNMTDLLANNPTPFEILPSTDRTMTFRATARDNRAGGGGVNYDTVVITAEGDSFFVNYPNGGQALAAGCDIEVLWTVGGGDVAANVNILFSQDGGVTFPTTLASGVPNDGAHTVTLPCVATTQTDARIRIEGAGNIFFDISNTNFTVAPQAPTASISGPAQVEVDATCTAVINVSGSLGDDCAIDAGDVTFTAEALGGTATVAPHAIVAVQNGAGGVTFSGTVTVSALTSCPTTVRITVDGTDNCGLTVSEFVDVDVVDTTPPELTATLNREFLWPPNHKLVDIVAEVTVTDNCPNPSFVLASITSNEPEDDLGDGTTSPDIVGAAIGTADTEFQLRSERMGPRNGRVYTILYTAGDNCGNADSVALEVRVDHDQSGNAFVVQLGSGTQSSDYLAVVVPSKRPLEGEGASDVTEPLTPVERGAEGRRAEPPHGLLLGNTLGVIEPFQVGRADVDGDGLPDAVALFALAKAEAIRQGSDALDGPVGLHYESALGESYLVPDLLAIPRDELGSTLGEAVRDVIANLPDPIEVMPSAGTLAPAATSAPGSDRIDAGVPAVTRLSGMRPNPFFRQTAIAFELARPATVRLEVYSPAGARVRGLAPLAFDPGRHAVTWDGRDDAGRRVPPGVYFVRFTGDGVVNTGKALLLP